MKETAPLQITPELAFQLYTKTPQQELRALVALGQHLNIDEIGLLVSKNRFHLEKYNSLFPDLVTLIAYLDRRRLIFQDQDTFIRYLSCRTVTPELDEIHQKIAATHKVLRRQIYKLIKTVLKLKEEGLLKTEVSNPDKNSLHFKVARELAKRLIRLWFINEVILFGSVAKGDFRPESDVDICLGVIPRRVSTHLYRIINCIANGVQEKYTGNTGPEKLGLFDFLRDNKIFREMGFLEAGYLLARNNTYTFALDGAVYTFDKDTAEGYSTREYGNNFYTVVFYPGIPTGDHPHHQAVFIVACNAVALYSVRLHLQQGGCQQPGFIIETKIINSHTELLKKYKLEGGGLKCLSTELIKAGIKKIYKGKKVYEEG